MHAYSRDLRDRVPGASERGERPGEIVRRLEVSRAHGGCRVSRIAHLQATLRDWLGEQPDLTLVQPCERLGPSSAASRSSRQRCGIGLTSGS